MSRTRTETGKILTKSLGRRVGEDNTGWRCLQCTFHNTEDFCKMCDQPRPKVPKKVVPSQGKPYYAEKKPQKEEKKSETYYDPTDGSFNVPIAGIKKYDHKPGKNNIPNAKESKKEEKKNTGNIVTLNDLKNKPEENEKIEKKEKKIDGKRDLLGMLQDAASDEPLPCMRKNANKMKK